jgi:hypothetical protein
MMAYQAVTLPAIWRKLLSFIWRESGVRFKSSEEAPLTPNSTKPYQMALPLRESTGMAKHKASPKVDDVRNQGADMFNSA